MIKKLIDEINKALNAGLYLVALNSALTLPDICGKAEYPDCKTGERYKKWYSEYVKGGDLPADIVYQLRCNMLHQGDVEPKCGKETKFELQTNAFTAPLGIEFCFHTDVTHADGTNEEKYTVYVGYLCSVICNAAQTYYNKNKDKFDFLNLKIVDMKEIFDFSSN